MLATDQEEGILSNPNTVESQAILNRENGCFQICTLATIKNEVHKNVSYMMYVCLYC